MFQRARRLTFAFVLAIFAASLTVVGLSTQPASAAVGCAVGVEPASLLVTRDANGNPTGRYAYGYAWADCTANEPVTITICVKFQTWTGSSWVNLTTYNCNTAAALHYGVTRTNKCSDIGSALIRTAGKVTIRGTTSGLSETKSGVEVGTQPCK